MWTWNQSAGELRLGGEVVARGYSGRGSDKNKADAQGHVGTGPIPRGRWKMVRMYDSTSVGPRAIELHAVDAKPDDDTHQPTGRGAFRIHGDSVKAPGTASKGCIILPRAVRERMWASGDHLLEVVA